MAHVERSFHMDQPPAQAQELFMRDVEPALARDGEFLLHHEQPGALVFSQGEIAPAAPEPGEHETLGEPELDTMARERSRILSRAVIPADDLERLFARHIRVHFTPDGEGTLVNISGHAEHALRDGLERLGTPGHWPETAGDPHD